jgi:histidinol-phosphate aminotransferase
MAPSFVRANVREMQGYTPGEQPAPGSRVVKLNTNENPFPPSPRVMQAIRELEGEVLRRYPQPLADTFRVAAARVLDVDPEMILAGNGSDDILTIATRTFVGPGGVLAYPEPTYSLYPVLAKIETAKTAAVAWGKDYTLPIDELLETRASAIYLANPNAPTGTMVPPDDVAKLAAKFKGLLLIDEAYAEFADANCLSLAKKFPNVVVSRTMSKAYSLAGLRFGFAVAQEAVIAEMLKVKDSYNCDALAIVAATAAIEDQAYAAMTWQHVRDERARVAAALEQIGFQPLPSQTNFLLAAVPGGDGRAFYEGLKSQGILVRFFDTPQLRDKIRITIGTSSENNALLGGLQALTTAEKAA